MTRNLKLPSGRYSPDREQWFAEWREVARPIETALGWTFVGIGTMMGFSGAKFQRLELPLEAVLQLSKALALRETGLKE